MKKIIWVILLWAVVISGNVFAIDGRSDGETKSNSSWWSPYVPIPVGMAINEKWLPGNSCPKWCRWNRRVNDCRCAQWVNRIMNIPWTSPVGWILPVAQDISDLCGTPPTKSKEDVYVRKIKTKGWLKSDLSVGEPGIQVEMIPSEVDKGVSARDRNPNSVKCACGTDVRGKDEAACGRICDFLKNNTAKSVCSSQSESGVKSPRDAASWLATGKRNSTTSWDVANGEQTIISPRDPASGLPTGKRTFKPSTVWEGDTSWSRVIWPDMEPDLSEVDYTGPCRPPYLCVELTAQIRKWWDGTVKWVTDSSSIVSPRDAASWLPTGKRQHKPLVIRASVDEDCDDEDCDGRIIIEADTDGDGEWEPLSKIKRWSWSNIGEWKKEYIWHVTLMR